LVEIKKFGLKYDSGFYSRLIGSIIKSMMSTTEILLENPNDYDARGEFAWMKWYKKIASPVTLKALNILKEDIPDIAKNAYHIATV